MKEKKKFTLDNSTVASNPGKIQFDYLVWLQHKPGVALFLFFLLVLFLILSMLSHAFFFVGVLSMIFINAFYWVRVKEHFSADSNPGLIIAESPPLYAVYTDLSKGVGCYPVIKVQRYRAKKASRVGDRLATVAVYADGGGSGSASWSDFYPLPIEYATSDAKSIQRELSRYSSKSWEQLYAGLDQLGIPKVGLYKLKTDRSNW